MQRDVKIGIAIGVLLIALIAVFWWFRHNKPNMPVTEADNTVTETGLPGPVVPVSPPIGVPGEGGPIVSGTGPAPMMPGGAPAGTVTMPAITGVPRLVPPMPPPGIAGGPTQTYKVQHGDTLSSISEHFYKTPNRWRIIYNVNKDKIGQDPSKLKDGMELTIPMIPPLPGTTPPSPATATGGTATAAAGGKYVIATGDTLTSIAQKVYGSATKANIDRIYQANKAKIGSDPDDLKVGMELVIPAAQ